MHFCFCCSIYLLLIGLLAAGVASATTDTIPTSNNDKSSSACHAIYTYTQKQIHVVSVTYKTSYANWGRREVVCSHRASCDSCPWGAAHPSPATGAGGRCWPRRQGRQARRRCTPGRRPRCRRVSGSPCACAPASSARWPPSAAAGPQATWARARATSRASSSTGALPAAGRGRRRRNRTGGTYAVRIVGASILSA